MGQRAHAGIIHNVMFARLLLAELVAAALTLARHESSGENCLDGSSGCLKSCDCVKFARCL